LIALRTKLLFERKMDWTFINWKLEGQCCWSECIFISRKVIWFICKRFVSLVRFSIVYLL